MPAEVALLLSDLGSESRADILTPISMCILILIFVFVSVSYTHLTLPTILRV